MSEGGLTSLFKDTSLLKKGSEVTLEAICGEGKVVGLYFSAHWCPPCRYLTEGVAAAGGFTRVLGGRGRGEGEGERGGEGEGDL
jgi:thiol-disulfide isomerase/thioredoxin